MPIIEASDLTKVYRVSQKRKGLLGAIRGLFRREYKEVRAVNGVSFKIEPGEMVGFLGPNGAGKTTTLKMLSGLIYPTSGTARVLNFVPWERAREFRQQPLLELRRDVSERHPAQAKLRCEEEPALPTFGRGEGAIQ